MKRYGRIALVAVLLAVALLAGAPVQPARAGSTITVEGAADTINPSNGFCSLREAIINANDPTVDHSGGDCEIATGDGTDTIVFSANPYAVTLTSQLPAVTSTVTIAGDGPAQTRIRASACNPVTLPGACTPATYRVLEVSGGGDLTLTGVTVQYGDCSALGCDTINNSGGGIFVASTATLTVQNSTITGNKAIEGGAIRNQGTLSISGSTISENDAPSGGGLYNEASLTITNSTVSSNTATEGGGLFDAGTSTIIIGSTFSGNVADGSGGVRYDAGTLTIDRSTFDSNSATSGHGGALGIVYDTDTSTTNITNSTFTGNSASGNGGAIYDDGQVLNITNSTIAGNTGGAGLYVYDNAGNGPMSVYNSILADNTGGDCIKDGGVTFNIDAHNQDTDDSCESATQKTVAQLGLGALADNGGGTDTMALSPRSAAINAGDNGVCPGVDQRSRTRPWAYTCDVGAFEFIPCFVNDDAGGGNTGATWDNAYTSLQTALGNSACTAVWVAEGLYKPAGDESDEFNVPPGVQLYGGFAGSEQLTSERMPGKYPSVLSGDIDNNDPNTNGVVLDYADVMGSNSDHVVVLDGTSTGIGVETIVDGFTITAGQADGGGFAVGGGMYCHGGASGAKCSPLLRNLTFSGNLAAGGSSAHGGALYNNGSNGGESSPTIENTTFRNNHADGNGGAVYNDGNIGGVSSPVVSNSTFAVNTADGWGGAMFNLGVTGGVSSPSLTSVTISGNTALVGGGMYNDADPGGTSHPVLTNVIMWGDTATASDSEEIYLESASTTINHSVVEGGDAGIVGGGTPWLSGVGNVSETPKLGVLNDNGGFTPTMALGWISSALEIGVGCPSADQRGISRPRGAGCDIGAYERIPPFSDYDPDYASDPAVFEKATGNWFVVGSTSGFLAPALAFGNDTDYIPVPGDYDGDAETDPAVFERATGNWFVVGSTAGFFTPALAFGDASNYIPVPGDYDGDNETDAAVFEKATGNWFVVGSTDGFFTPALAFGDDTNYIPVQGDYDGDGKTDPGVFERATGNWFVVGSTDGFFTPALAFGDDTNYIPVQGDYDGDGFTDPGVFEKASGNWFAVGSNSGFFSPALGFGNDTNYIPQPADYDGDARVDAGVFERATGNWFVVGSSNGFSTPALAFGNDTDYIPVVK